ncbi:glycosyltransferase [Enterovibrio norvegicus]|uniref:glycosyltransferase n=1 Tax=Enterovibrio norvegicus TaxID=188144 RepID=UPI00354B22D2
MKEINNTVVVTATSLIGGGGLTILNQFIGSCNDNCVYHLFISEQLHGVDEKSNVKIYKVPRPSSFQRVIWDSYRLRVTVESLGIKPDVIVCLQNTTIRYPGVPKVIYLHQGISLSEFKWSFLKVSERNLAFYRYVYPFFIFLHNDEMTHFVVQTNWMKEALLSQFSIENSHVKVIKPSIARIESIDNRDIKESLPPCVIKHDISLFYPATPELFKEHLLVIRALKEIQSYKCISNIGLYITVDKGESKVIDSEVKKLGLSDNVVYMGRISFDEVQEMYETASALVFPSKIESFGLPLIEAAVRGRKIIASDTCFSRELLSEYDGVEYVNNNIKCWADSIDSLCSNRDFKYKKYRPCFDTSWSDFFKLLDDLGEVNGV